MSRREDLTRATSFLLLFVLFVSKIFAAPLPALPDFKALDPYFAESIIRSIEFLQTRPENPELMIKIAIVLEETGQTEFAEQWRAAIAKLNLAPEEVKKLSEKIRKQFRFQPPPTQDTEDTTAVETPIEEFTGPEREALLAEAANNMALAAKEYRTLFLKTHNLEYLEKAAERYLWANDNANAANLLIRLQKSRPKDRNLVLKIAQVHGWLSDFEKAVFYYHLAQKIKFTNDVESKMVLAAFETGNLVFAEPIILSWLKRFPNDQRVAAMHAQLLLEAGKINEGGQIFARLPHNILNENQLLLFAQYLLEKMNHKEATRLAKMALGKVKQSDFEFRLRALILLAYAAEAEKEYDLAVKLLERSQLLCLKLTKKLLPAVLREYKINILKLKAKIIQLKKGADSALPIRQQILQISPSDTDSLVFMGEYWKSKENLDKATEFFDAANKSDAPNNFVLWSIADLAMKNGDFWKARGILEKLSNEPDFSDEAMLIKAWQETKAWQKLADFFKKEQARLLPQYRDEMIEAFSAAGRKDQAALIIVDELKKNPFDEAMEKSLIQIASYVPDVWQGYQRQKPDYAKNYYVGIIASLTTQLAQTPNDISLLSQRAETYGFSGRPANALSDYLQLMRLEPENVTHFNKALEMSEWAGNSKKTLEIRQDIHAIEPENATNSLRLANLAMNKRKVKEAREYLSAAEKNPGLNQKEFYATAFPIYLNSGEFLNARKTHENAQNIKSSFKTAEEKTLLLDYELALSRDIGPVIRTDFNFFHDTDNVRLSSTNLFGRFALRNHQFFEASMSDLAMTRDNNAQRGFRGKELEFSFNKIFANKRLRVALPMLFGNSNAKTRIFTPSITYTHIRPKSESGFSFRQRPVLDTPEALLQGLSSNDFQLWHSFDLGQDLWLRLNAGYQRNSFGYASRSGGFSLEKVLQYSPLRTLRYSFQVEDGDSEISDIFYLEDYLQIHQLSWGGSNRFKSGKDCFALMNWELSAGITNYGDPFFGLNGSIERKIFKDFFLKLFAEVYTSENSRFAGSDRYKYWKYGLMLEKRYW